MAVAKIAAAQEDAKLGVRANINTTDYHDIGSNCLSR
jgi:hypothetical protein